MGSKFQNPTNQSKNHHHFWSAKKVSHKTKKQWFAHKNGKKISNKMRKVLFATNICKNDERILI
jgi:hypothetical protein